MVFLGFVWLVLLILDLTWGLNRPLQYLSITIWIVFVIDFLLKFLVAPVKLIYLRKNWLTGISLIIPALRVFRILRLLRFLKGVRLVKIVASLNRSMRSLAATMRRRGFSYVMLLAVVVTFGGAAGMYNIERGHPGFENYGISLWWTAMRVITAGSDYWPVTPEGRGLAFILSLFGYGIFGYVTAMLATFFIGRDAEDKSAPVAGAKDIREIAIDIMKIKQALERIEEDVRKG
jgi:voltage-gated potassium channel